MATPQDFQSGAVQAPVATGQSSQSTYFPTNELPGYAQGLTSALSQNANQSAGQYQNYLNNPTGTSLYQNSLSGLLAALQPSEADATRNLQDAFRSAGNMASGAYGTSNARLQGDILRNRQVTASQLLAQQFPQMTQALMAPQNNAVNLLQALKLSQGFGSNPAVTAGQMPQQQPNFLQQPAANLTPGQPGTGGQPGQPGSTTNTPGMSSTGMGQPNSLLQSLLNGNQAAISGNNIQGYPGASTGGSGNGTNDYYNYTPQNTGVGIGASYPGQYQTNNLAFDTNGTPYYQGMQGSADFNNPNNIQFGPSNVGNQVDWGQQLTDSLFQ